MSTGYVLAFRHVSLEAKHCATEMILVSKPGGLLHGVFVGSSSTSQSHTMRDQGFEGMVATALWEVLP